MAARKKPRPGTQKLTIPPAHDWRTSDADEVNRRRLRAQTERFVIRNLDAARPVFSRFRMESATGMTYAMETRSCPCAWKWWTRRRTTPSSAWSPPGCSRRLPEACARSFPRRPPNLSARPPLLDAVHLRARALAVENRLPEPPDPAASLLVPLAGHFGGNLAILQGFLAGENVDWRAVAGVLQPPAAADLPAG